MDSEILANLEKSLQPGQLAYAEISFAVQAGCDMRDPPLGIGRTQFLGFARKQRPIVRTYPLQDVLIREGKQEIYSSERIDFFERYVIGNDDHEWRKPFEHYNFKLDVKHLPELEIWGKMSADEREKKYRRQAINLLARLQKRDTSAFAIVVHTDRDDIVQILAKHPYGSAQAFCLLEYVIPLKIQQAGRVKAIEDITSFYRKYEKKLGEDLGRSFEVEFDYLKNNKVASFVEEFDVMPGVTLNTKKFLAGVEVKIKN
jgi:hypothetical protein